MTLEFNAPRTGRHLRERPVVLPEERLSWPRTIGFGAQHVVAMFGATFLFPIAMGLDPQLAILTSGVSTILFLLIVRGKVPSYLGSSAAFVGGATAIYAQGGMQPDVTGAILVAGVVLAVVGVVVHLVGPRVVDAVLPPVVTGAVVMLIGLALAPLVGQKFWPQDGWVAFATMSFVIILLVAGRGFVGRIAVLLGLVFGFVLSYVLDLLLGPINSMDPYTLTLRTRDRVDLSGVSDATWFGLPVHTGGVTPDGTPIVGWHLPEFHWLFVLLVVPAVVAVVAENVGHVKAVSEMVDRDLDGYVGRTLLADGLTTVMASAVGSAPTTTYAENIGVMAATRVYSVAAYYVAAVVAICLGVSPKFGAVIEATPGGVIGGITVVLYGMIGLLGVRIWMVNKVDFGEPVNLVPVAAGVVVAIGGMALHFGESFAFTGIALGSLVTIVGYHVARFAAILTGTAPPTKKRRRAR
ncbi:uracil-xanthine permease family protein [Angustibacter sp. McL0619]|uniref:uracil-xanthine permease family protein n=1 Tax=Angustibacter sp. McL0619 TaxID=3415676 RepID=UPI003CFA4F21